ncbi:hypothetical protein PMI12_02487 [Variovorax sp. CF313]|nr:hypothetical protein PMI12_02487 [Variovorax sp. CF313]
MSTMLARWLETGRQGERPNDFACGSRWLKNRGIDYHLPWRHCALGGFKVGP